MTLPQNGGNRVSEDLKFQNFCGKDAPRSQIYKAAAGPLSSNPLCSRGEHFRNFWVGMCRWEPGTLNLHQS